MIICIDFDEKYIKFMAFDCQGKLINNDLVMSINNNPNTIRGNLVNNTYKYIERLNYSVEQIVGIAVSCPGIISPNGNDVAFFNEKWGKISLRNELKSKFDRMVILENNGYAAAWGEKKCGAGKELNTFIYIFAEESVGGGIVFKDKLFRGPNNSAALFGHNVVKTGGKKCICGNDGCLEAYISTRGIVDTIEENMKNGKIKISKEDTLSNKQLIKKVNSLAHGGNSYGDSLLRETGQYLGIVIYNYCILIVPDAIIVSGGVFETSDLVLKYMQEYLNIALSNIEKYFGKKIKCLSVNNILR